ncbi:beta-1,4-glucuronyltransferase 1-like [Haematobia irritans]|uniref:beta-1,4-glucuronyltransferase 1-like n=1 Tax=Haematobia irritans TaxID=7368 RepID=UPI003F4F4E58
MAFGSSVIGRRFISSYGRFLGILSVVTLTVIILWQIFPLSNEQIPMKIKISVLNYKNRVQLSDTRSYEIPLETSLKLKSILGCQDRELDKMELLSQSDCWVLKNLIRGRRSINMGCAESITLTTVGDIWYMKNLEILMTRWLGPISIALFAPGDDFVRTMDSIQYMRHCLPSSELIRDYVTFHIYFPTEDLPLDPMPLDEEEALKWPHDCSTMFAPYEDIKRARFYRYQRNLTLPINVGRNVARSSVNTHFILATDIELYPSLKLIPQFLQMISDDEDNFIVESNRRRVFALPVFDLDRNALIPDNKEELMRLYDMKLAMPMHANSCSYCSLIPHQERWLALNNNGNKMEILDVTQRYNNMPFWEPFYISDNTEPEYDERLSWDSQSDKRMHNYAMCLLDYEYDILHPAFLTHSPGLKKFDLEGDRMSYVEEIVPSLLAEYAEKYGINEICIV